MKIQLAKKVATSQFLSHLSGEEDNDTLNTLHQLFLSHLSGEEAF